MRHPVNRGLLKQALRALTPLTTLPPPRDLFHDDFMKELLASRIQVVPNPSTVGLPRPSSPEEIVQRSLGLDHSLVREALKPKPKKVIDVFQTKIEDSLIDPDDEAKIDKVTRNYTSPVEVARMRHNISLVSRFTFPLK